MTNEQAIEELKELSQAIDTVLSLIKEQQQDIESLEKSLNDEILENYDKQELLNKQLKQKNKQIELMAKYWNASLSMCDNCDKIVEKYEENNCQDCIKQYFAELVEKE